MAKIVKSGDFARCVSKVQSDPDFGMLAANGELRHKIDPEPPPAASQGCSVEPAVVLRHGGLLSFLGHRILHRSDENGRTMPYAVAIVIGLMCGLNAALWIVVLARLPLILLAFLVIFQFFLGKTISWVVDSMVAVFAFAPVPSSSGIRFSAVCILVVVIVSYALFVSFIRAEGIEAGRIRSQLELAHGIQKTLVPPVGLRTEGFEIYGISQPSDKVGGDLVDAVVLPQGDIVAYVADIAGHGLPAGILMGMLKTAARTALLDAELGPPAATLPLLLEKLNRVLPGVKEPQMYATLTAFRLNADGAALRRSRKLTHLCSIEVTHPENETERWYWNSIIIRRKARNWMDCAASGQYHPRRRRAAVSLSMGELAGGKKL
jgi:hypothetical protein